MKNNVKISSVQFSPWPIKEMEKNVDFIKEKIIALSNQGNELIVFPELSLTNFFEAGPNGKAFYWEHGALSIDHDFIQSINDIIKQQNCYVIIGFAERSSQIGKIYNSAALLGPKGVIGVTRKMHLPGLEKLYFSKGTDIPIFDTPIGKIGISICYDSMFPEYVRTLAVKGADMIAMPSSIWKGGGKGGIGLEKSKRTLWDYLPIVAAIEHQAFVIACNGGGSYQIGDQLGTWERMGLSKIVAPTGEVLAQTEGNSEIALCALMELEKLKEARNAYSFLIDREPFLYQDLVNKFM